LQAGDGAVPPGISLSVVIRNPPFIDFFSVLV
jgi:hypothetical protein